MEQIEDKVEAFSAIEATESERRCIGQTLLFIISRSSVGALSLW